MPGLFAAGMTLATAALNVYLPLYDRAYVDRLTSRMKSGREPSIIPG